MLNKNTNGYILCLFKPKVSNPENYFNVNLQDSCLCCWLFHKNKTLYNCIELNFSIAKSKERKNQCGHKKIKIK